MPPPNYPPTPGPSRSPMDQQYLQAVFDEFEAYAFSDDPDFKAGLPNVISSIRAQKRSAAQIDELIGRAQWFYFSRMKGLNIPWDAYANYSRSQTSTANATPSPSSASPSNSSASRSSTPAHRQQKDPIAVLNNLAEARRMMSSDNRPPPPGREGSGEMSFSMLCSLISEGRAGEVPGIRQIPDQLNASPPSQSIMPQRLKPWERISPPGTSASFTDPPLAPSPSAFDMSFNVDSAYGNLDVNDLSISRSTSHSPLSSFGNQSVSPNLQQTHEYSNSPPSLSAGGSHHTSPSQSFANLSFATNATTYGAQLGLEDLSLQQPILGQEQAQGQGQGQGQEPPQEPFVTYDPTAPSNIWPGGNAGGSGSGYMGF